MHFPKSWEPLGVVVLEVSVEVFLGVDPQELAHDLYFVSTSESESVGSGPRPRSFSCSMNQSSTSQKTAMMRVLRSTGPETSFRFGWFGRYRA